MISQQFIQKHLYNRSLLSYILFPFSIIFAGIQMIRRIIYSSFPGLSYRSSCQIISVGNIVSGGSGKTPLTIFLAEYLSGKGRNVAVSHRDYGGNFEQGNKLISNREEVFSYAEYAGDEAYLLALKLPGIPVIAGKNRKRSIEILLNTFPDLEYIILDDSFQHLKVKHDIDLITINADGGVGNGFVLPAGILREPVSTLSEVDMIIYNGSEEIPRYLHKYKQKVITGKYRVKGFYDLKNNQHEVTSLQKKKIMLLSGIGNPASFEATVRESGMNFVHHYKFADHYHYDAVDVERLKRDSLTGKTDLFITTEKDLVKLKKLNLTGLNLLVLKIELQLSEPEKLQIP